MEPSSHFFPTPSRPVLIDGRVRLGFPDVGIGWERKFMRSGSGRSVDRIHQTSAARQSADVAASASNGGAGASMDLWDCAGSKQRFPETDADSRSWGKRSPFTVVLNHGRQAGSPDRKPFDVTRIRMRLDQPLCTRASHHSLGQAAYDPLLQWVAALGERDFVFLVTA